MKKYRKIIGLAIALVLIGVIVFAITKSNQSKKDETFRMTTSFYPIYMVAINLNQGTNQTELSNLASQNIGCIHDYTMATADLKKLEKSDVLIQNGLGLENFTEKVTSTYQKLKVIDSSEGIQNVIRHGEETNGHIWTSLNLYIEQVKTISKKLQEYNPENKEVYEKNEKDYIDRINTLKSEYDSLMQELNGTGVVILNESFEYLARDAKLDMIVIETDHEESTISAETLKNTIEEMKQKNIKSIIIDKNDNRRNAETLSKETGAKIYEFDSCLTGSLDKDSYINAMRGNFESLKKIKENR